MGLLDNYTGIGMCPRPTWGHQLIMKNFIVKVDNELTNENNLIVMTEATVTEDWDDLAPDVVAFDEQKYPRIIVEITNTRELKRIFNKFKKLILRFPQAECWTFNYEKKELFGYEPESRTWLSSNEFELHSKYLSCEMISYFF